jgi:hypothetical protein
MARPKRNSTANKTIKQGAVAKTKKSRKSTPKQTSTSNKPATRSSKNVPIVPQVKTPIKKSSKQAVAPKKAPTKSKKGKF